jgi:mRNA-degrading endonuclease RelE of RelBE toxin-antitoxin system
MDTYCNPISPIFTFDSIVVVFFEDKFDHAFFESANRVEKDKSVFSQTRAERILWIKETLEDPTADIRQGYDSKTKTYDNSRRVAIVKGDYVVIIKLTSEKRASFITAYVADNSIQKIMLSPEWQG